MLLNFWAAVWKNFDVFVELYVKAVECSWPPQSIATKTLISRRRILMSQSWMVLFEQSTSQVRIRNTIWPVFGRSDTLTTMALLMIKDDVQVSKLSIDSRNNAIVYSLVLSLSCGDGEAVQHTINLFIEVKQQAQLISSNYLALQDVPNSSPPHHHQVSTLLYQA